MPLDPVTGTLISTGVNAIGSYLNYRGQKDTNQANIDAAKAQAEQSRKWALEDWERTNAYNHPKQQMARLREAGLSVQMAMGKGAENTAAMIRGTENKVPAAQAPQIDVSGVANAFTEYNKIKQMQVQTDNMHQMNENLKTQNELAKAKTASEYAKKAGQDLMNLNYGVTNRLLEYDYGQKLRFSDLQYDTAILDYAMKAQAKEINANEWELKKLLGDKDITLKYEQALATKASRLGQEIQNDIARATKPEVIAYKKKELEKIGVEIENLQKTGKFTDGATAKQEVERQYMLFKKGLDEKYLEKSMNRQRAQELINMGTSVNKEIRETAEGVRRWIPLIYNK
jgi:hypothetical protein